MKPPLLLILLLSIHDLRSSQLEVSTDDEYGEFDIKDEGNLCDIECFDDSHHVGCKCNNGGVNENPPCLPLNPNEVIEFRQEMVEEHNFFRSKIAMGAFPTINVTEPMNTLDYDLGLEYMATCTAYKCSQEKDLCFPLKKFKKTIQNIFFMPATHLPRSTLKIVGYAVRSWYNEVPLSRFKPREEKWKLMKWGHWSAMMWPNATHLGCSARYQENTEDDLPFSIYVVCNYGSNVELKKEVKKKGPTCIQCPKDVACSRNYIGLCGLVHEIPSAELEIIINGTVFDTINHHIPSLLIIVGLAVSACVIYVLTCVLFVYLKKKYNF